MYLPGFIHLKTQSSRAGLKLPDVFMKVAAEVPLKLPRFGENPRVLTGGRAAVDFYREVTF